MSSYPSFPPEIVRIERRAYHALLFLRGIDATERLQYYAFLVPEVQAAFAYRSPVSTDIRDTVTPMLISAAQAMMSSRQARAVDVFAIDMDSALPSSTIDDASDLGDNIWWRKGDALSSTVENVPDVAVANTNSAVTRVGDSVSPEYQPPDIDEHRPTTPPLVRRLLSPPPPVETADGMGMGMGGSVVGSSARSTTREEDELYEAPPPVRPTRGDKRKLAVVPSSEGDEEVGPDATGPESCNHRKRVPNPHPGKLNDPPCDLCRRARDPCRSGNFLACERCTTRKQTCSLVGTTNVRKVRVTHRGRPTATTFRQSSSEYVGRTESNRKRTSAPVARSRLRRAIGASQPQDAVDPPTTGEGSPAPTCSFRDAPSEAELVGMVSGEDLGACTSIPESKPNIDQVIERLKHVRAILADERNVDGAVWEVDNILRVYDSSQ